MLCDSKQCVHGSDFFHKILRCSPNSSGTESISPFLMSRVLLEYFILFCSKLLQRFQIILHQPYISQATVSQIFNINAKSHQNTFKYILETFFLGGGLMSGSITSYQLTIKKAFGQFVILHTCKITCPAHLIFFILAIICALKDFYVWCTRQTTDVQDSDDCV